MAGSGPLMPRFHGINGLNRAVTWVTMVFREYSLGILPRNCEYIASGISFNVGFVRCMTSKRQVLNGLAPLLAANVSPLVRYSLEPL